MQNRLLKCIHSGRRDGETSIITYSVYRLLFPTVQFWKKLSGEKLGEQQQKTVGLYHWKFASTQEWKKGVCVA